MTAVAIVSGGMDSATLAYHLADQGQHLHLLSFDYGQRHRRELASAAEIAHRLGAPHDVIDLTAAGRHLTGSALTDPDVAVPDGHYAEPSMRATVVPNRNAIMLSVAFGVASAEQANLVATAVHAGDHFVYPDCRPEFLAAFQAMQEAALDGFPTPTLHAPYVNWTKTQIAAHGGRLRVPFEATWSCYRGEEIHCGRCGTCVERIQALTDAGVDDPTVYATRDYALALPR